MASFPKLSSGSMTVAPSLASTSMAKYPVTFEHAWKTRVVRFLNDQEQAWSVRPRLFGATLQYSKMNGYDTSLVRDFFLLQKGKYVDPALVNVFDMEFQGVVYTNVVFDQDDFSATVDGSETFSFQIKVRQLISSFSSPGPGGTTPATSLELHVLSATTTTTYAPHFQAQATLETLGFVPFLFALGPWALRDDPGLISPGPSTVFGSSIGLSIVGTAGGSGLSQWLVYDLYGIFTDSNGASFTARPTQMQTIPGLNEDSAIVNPGNAYDGDQSTFAVISRSGFGPLTFPTTYQFIF